MVSRLQWISGLRSRILRKGQRYQHGNSAFLSFCSGYKVIVLGGRSADELPEDGMKCYRVLTNILTGGQLFEDFRILWVF
jgi:hypothetical protein